MQRPGPCSRCGQLLLPHDSAVNGSCLGCVVTSQLTSAWAMQPLQGNPAVLARDSPLNVRACCDSLKTAVAENTDVLPSFTCQRCACCHCCSCQCCCCHSCSYQCCCCLLQLCLVTGHNVIIQCFPSRQCSKAPYESCA